MQNLATCSNWQHGTRHQAADVSMEVQAMLPQAKPQALELPHRAAVWTELLHGAAARLWSHAAQQREAG